jgi:hypothetical protein
MMESALFETRSKFFQAKEKRSSIATTVANVASPSVTCSSGQSNDSETGIGMMESALFETRSKFFQAKEKRSSIATTVANVASPSVTCYSGQSNDSDTGENCNMDAEKASRVVQSLFGALSSRYENSKGGKLMSNAAPEKMPTENEQIVNEILHDIHGSFADISDGAGTVEGDFKVSSNLIVKFSDT